MSKKIIFRSAWTSSSGSVCMSVTLIAHRLRYTVYPNTKFETLLGASILAFHFD